MLLSIVKLPAPIGTPIDTRIPLITEKKIPSNLLGHNFFYWPDIPTDQPPLVIGSRVNTKVPYDLYKSFHISDANDEYVFETIVNVSQKDKEVIPLYTKIRNRNGKIIGISPNAIIKFSDSPSPIMSLTSFIGEESFLGNRSKSEVIIVPPLFSEEAAHSYMRDLAKDYLKGWSHWKFTVQYKPLLNHCLPVFSTFYEEKYIRTPFYELMGYHPNVDLNHLVNPRWYMYDQLNYEMNAFHIDEMVTNNTLFAEEVLTIYNLDFDTLDVTTNIVCGTEEENGVIVIENSTSVYTDAFDKFFGLNHSDDSKFIRSLTHILGDFICKFKSSFSDESDRYQIRIRKNNVEEISILVKTKNKTICFYYSIPLLMLTTLSVGWYL